MNFSDEYKKQNDSIVPDADFLKQLQKNMEQVKLEQQNITHETKVIPIRRFTKLQKIATAAAMIGFIAVISFVSIRMFGKDSTNPNQSEHAPIVGDMTDIQPTQSTISKGKWYSDDASEEEIESIFFDRIAGSGLTKMYCNSENKFSDENLMTKDSIDNLVDDITDQEEIIALPSDYVGIDYYMAVFEDGTIIKFTKNEDMIHIQNTEFVLKIKK